MDYFLFVVLIGGVGALGWWLGSRSPRARENTTEEASLAKSSSDKWGAPPANQTAQPIRAKIRLGRTYLLVVSAGVLLKALIFLENLMVYGANDPSLTGVSFILVGYLGETIGQSLWIFVLPLLYRAFLRIAGKPYSRSFETAALLLGGLFVLIGISGSIGEPPGAGLR